MTTPTELAGPQAPPVTGEAPWVKYSENHGPLRVALPEDIARTVRVHAEHYELTPEQVVCAALAIVLLDERSWQAALKTLRLCAKLPPTIHTPQPR